MKKSMTVSEMAALGGKARWSKVAKADRSKIMRKVRAFPVKKRRSRENSGVDSQ